MLILAGVSINATVGDNGILSKAQDTVFVNSCAYLEEYFNQLYATCSMDGATEGDTPLHTIMNNGYQHYFFSTSEGTCLKKNYTNEETGESQTLVLYLIKKEQLPEEIQAQITGGDGLESRDYRKLRGCYGITSDLKAYYCEDGLETILGLTTSDLNADSPDIVYADENSILAQVVNGGTAPIMNQGLKSIRTLTIDSVEELSILQEFSRFINLTTVYFKNITINSLAGIEGASEKLDYVKFTNCNVQDYSAINGLTNLSQLYLVKPAGKDEEIARLGSTDKGIASGEFSKLEYFGILGEEKYLNSTDTNYSTERYGITDISSLANFSDVTKKAIRYMNLQNLQLTNITALIDFTNTYYLRMDANALVTFEGIQNMSSLKFLIAPNLYSTTTASYTLGQNETTEASDTDVLKYIYKDNNANTSLNYVDLRYNSQLKHIEYLATCSAIRYCYLAGCTSIINASTIGTVLGNCGSNYSISGDYGLEIISDTTTVLSLEGKTMTIAEFEQLKNRTKLTHLNLKKVKIMDDAGTELSDTTSPTITEEINNVLKTCTNLKYLNLNGISKLNSIEFVKTAGSKLIALDIQNTSITTHDGDESQNGLELLNSYCTDLGAILINNKSDQLKYIQTIINRVSASSKNAYWNNLCQGFINEGNQDYTDCTSITKIVWYRRHIGNIDFSPCTSLSFIKAYGNGYTLSTSVEYFEGMETYKVIIPEGSNLKSLHIRGASFNNTYNFETLCKELANCVNLESLDVRKMRGITMDLNHLIYLKDLPNLVYLRVGHQDGTERQDLLNFEGISNLTRLKTLTVVQSNLTEVSWISSLKDLETCYLYQNDITSLAGIEECTKLVTLSARENQITDTAPLGSLVNLTSLNLNNNSISDVYSLMNCTKLEELHLKNNALNDFAYYKDASGRSIGYEVMDVFYDLNYEKKGSLKTLYMSGNTFDDTEILWDLNWEAGDGGIFKPTT